MNILHKRCGKVQHQNDLRNTHWDGFKYIFTKVCKSLCGCYRAGLGFSWTQMPDCRYTSIGSSGSFIIARSNLRGPVCSRFSVSISMFLICKFHKDNLYFRLKLRKRSSQGKIRKRLVFLLVLHNTSVVKLSIEFRAHTYIFVPQSCIDAYVVQ